LVAGRRWQNLALQSKSGSHRLQSTRRAEAVAQHSLVRRDCETIGMRAEHIANRARFRRVVDQRAGAVRIDIVDVVDVASGVGKRLTHRARHGEVRSPASAPMPKPRISA